MFSLISHLMGNAESHETNVSRSILPKSRVVKAVVAVALVSLVRQSGAEAVTTLPTPCQVTAFLHPGHAAVSLNCNDEFIPMTGFYPSLYSGYPETLRDRSEAGESDSAHLDLGDSHPFYLLNYAEQSSSYGSTSQSSSRSSSSSSSAPSSGAITPLSNTYLSAGRAAKLSNPKLQSQLSLGSSLFQISSLWFNTFLPADVARAWVGDDGNGGQIISEPVLFHHYCNDNSCLKASVNVTSEKYSEIAQMIHSMQNAYTYSNLKKCPNDGTEVIPYQMIGNNCVDFVRKIMDATEVANWRDSLHYTNPPKITDKIIAIAWHYFNWT